MRDIRKAPASGLTVARLRLSLCLGLGLAGCISADQYPGDRDGGAVSGSGGSAAGSGGSTVAGTGGAAVGTGGVTGSGGGAIVAGTGGRLGTGGAAAGSGGRIGGTGGSLGTSIPLPFMEDFEDGALDGWYPLLEPPPSWTVVMDGASKAASETRTTSDESVLVGGDVAWTNQVVEVKAKLAAGDSGTQIWVLARFKDARNYYFMQMEDDEIVVRRYTNGSSTTLTRVKLPVAVPGSDPMVVLGQWYVLKLAVSTTAAGTIVTGWVDSAMTPPYMDTAPISNGGVAVGVVGGTARFDYVKVTAP